MKPYGFVYLTTNVKNGMRYIGQTHYRKNLRDTYIGSGKEMKHAIAKHGQKAFVRETLFEAFTKGDLDWAECHFISEHNAVKSRKFYNISPGGRASLGFTGKQHSVERNESLSKKMLLDHHSAVGVTLDGIAYNSVAKAQEATGFTRPKIHKFITTGVHPSDQVHGGHGAKKPNNGKTWNLESAEGQHIITTGLKQWCLRTGVSYAIRDHQGSLYHGWILTRPSA